MKTKLIFSTEKKEKEQWTELPFIPRINEWIRVAEFLTKEDIVEIYQSTVCWSTGRGSVTSVEYRRDSHEFYAEIYIWCED